MAALLDHQEQYSEDKYYTTPFSLSLLFLPLVSPSVPTHNLHPSLSLLFASPSSSSIYSQTLYATITAWQACLHHSRWPSCPVYIRSRGSTALLNTCLREAGLGLFLQIQTECKPVQAKNRDSRLEIYKNTQTTTRRKKQTIHVQVKENKRRSRNETTHTRTYAHVHMVVPHYSS